VTYTAIKILDSLQLHYSCLKTAKIKVKKTY